jgi:hypothetical protein
MTRELYGAARRGARARGALRAWLVLVAPGMLVTRGVISVAFVVAPWLTRAVQVAVVARAVAAGLLFGQVASTVAVLRWPDRWSMGVFGTLLAIDFLLCGLLLSTERQLWGVGVPIAVVALAMSFEVAGWRSLAVAVVLIGAGFAAAAALGIGTPLVWPDTLMFGTVLSVETSFPGFPAVAAAVRAFPTALHVETSFGGASGLGWTTAALLPALAIPLAALGAGVAVSVVRVWRVRTVQAAPAGHSPLGGGTATVGMTLLFLAAVTPARAQCEPSGHAAFAAGLDALSDGDLAAATRIFFQLVQTQPACPEARNNLAVLFVEQDRLVEATAQLQRALELNPTYERARVNLARVDALRKDRQNRCEPAAATATPEPSATPAHSEEEPAGEATANGIFQDTQPADATPTVTPSAEARPTPALENIPRRVASPPARGTPRERGAAAVCVIEPAQARICVYQRGEAPMAGEDCYAIAVAQVRSWPRWLVASAVTAQQIRLQDETGQTRLEIVAEDAKVSGDALRLRKAEWQALAARVVPWRTAWLIVE